MVKLSRDFITVVNEKGKLYGGRQQNCRQKHMQGYGCGVIGCANILFYDAHKLSGNLEYEEKEYL